jgi:hypothetical protein
MSNGMVSLTLVVWIELYATSVGAVDASKAAIPDAARQQKARAEVQNIYKDDLAQAKKAQEKLLVARRLLQIGLDEQRDGAARWALLTLAREGAADAGDVEAAFAAAEALDRSYAAVDLIKLKVEAATVALRVLRTPDDRRRFAEHVLTAVGAAVAADRYDLARQLCELALTAARSADDAALVRRVAATVQRVKEIQTAFADVQNAEVVLARDPADAHANGRIGRFRCLLKGDWDTGLPMLKRGAEAGLRALAEQDLGKPATPEARVALADGWWAAAEKLSGAAKANAVQRAAGWYQLAMPALEKGLTREKVERRLKELVAAATALQSGVIETTKAGHDGLKFTWKDLPKYAKLRLIPAWEKARPRTTLANQAVSDALVLTRANSPYLVTGFLLVEANATLTAEPGVVVLFAPGAQLTNKGTLNLSSEGDWIVLAAADRTRRWKGVASRGVVAARRCLLVGADAGIAIEECGKGLTANECVFAGNGRGAQIGNHSSATFEDCFFFRNDGGGVVSDMDGFAELARCLLVANAKGFAATYNGGCRASQSTFYGNEVGIEAARYECKRAEVRECNVVGNTRAQATSSGSLLNARGNFWGVDLTRQLAAGPQPAAIHAKVEAFDWLAGPVEEAFPALPGCEYLAIP